jgi:hypothetical protein
MLQRAPTGTDEVGKVLSGFSSERGQTSAPCTLALFRFWTDLILVVRCLILAFGIYPALVFHLDLDLAGSDLFFARRYIF